MKGTQEDGELEARIRAGELTRRDAVRRLGELAFGTANDCVRLALEEGVDPAGLDLSLLSQVKWDGRGAVEVKLLDRLEILDRLIQATQAEKENLGDFLAAIQGGEGM